MCFNAFDKAADLDVLDHPVLNFIYYLVCFGFCMQCNCMVRYHVIFFGHVLRIEYLVCGGCLVYFFVSPSLSSKDVFRLYNALFLLCDEKYLSFVLMKVMLLMI